MKTIRAFLAVKLDLETVRRLAKVQHRLRDRCEEAGISVAWVPPPNMHLTIRFLGNVTEPMSVVLKELVEPATRTEKPFEMDTVGLGVFPEEGNPSVIWAGIDEGADALKHLFDAVCSQLGEAGFNVSEANFRCHVTIGRIKEGSAQQVNECMQDDVNVTFGTSVVRNIYCYRSDLLPVGAEYHSLWRLPLGGRYPGDVRRRSDADKVSPKEEELVSETETSEDSRTEQPSEEQSSEGLSENSNPRSDQESELDPKGSDTE